MSWKNIIVRALMMAIAVGGILYWAEHTFPMGGLLLFLLLFSIGLTWTIISFLRDDQLLSDLFD